MRHFWALPACLRLALVLAAQKQFQVQDDLLAYPQYEVQYADDYVTEAFARSKLRHSASRHHQAGDLHSKTEVHVDRYRPPEETSDPAHEDGNVEYEEMMTDGQRYLCAIPVVAALAEEGPGRTNDTSSEQERETELANANRRGWELVSAMQGNCVYYNDGWWSYSYCFNAGVKQFHQLAHTRGVPAWPPVEDPAVPGFMLGSHEQEKSLKKIDTDGTSSSDYGELVVKGKSKYLVQRLDGGTECDLTHEPRRIEVQFHCNPLYAHDVISMIKELSTCTYLMVIQTPRLCSDIAFQPPQKDKPNGIVCKEIVKPEDIEQFEMDRQLIREIDDALVAAHKKESDGFANTQRQQIVGDIVVGGRHIVPEGIKIEKSAIVGGGKEKFIVTIADSEGTMISKSELEKLKIGDMKTIIDLRDKVKKLAGSDTWRLDLVDTARGPEFRGIFGPKDNQESKRMKDEGDTSDSNKGSEEEYYKEEL